jgi:hypothetical protein
MKIIFLDIDGVLNVYCEGRDQFGCTFHSNFVDNLRNIIEQTGAKIVISSTWRSDGLETMQEMWKFRNYPGEVIDITPLSFELINLGLFEYYDQIERGHEIEMWLKVHPEVSNYVIIDDDNDMLDNQKANFVRTANNMNHPDKIDIGYGLTKICSEKAIEILKD